MRNIFSGTAKPRQINAMFLGVLLSFAPLALAEDSIWKDDTGRPAPNTESRNSKNGFGGILMITRDADWKKKWDTSPDTIPRFHTTDTLERGKVIFALIFFSNAQLNSARKADITADIDLIKPDGTKDIHRVDVKCFRSEIKGDPKNVYLGDPVIGFKAEPKDPTGNYTVRVTLKDNLRHVQLPLKTSFTLK